VKNSLKEEERGKRKRNSSEIEKREGRLVSNLSASSFGYTIDSAPCSLRGKKKRGKKENTEKKKKGEGGSQRFLAATCITSLLPGEPRNEKRGTRKKKGERKEPGKDWLCALDLVLIRTILAIVERQKTGEKKPGEKKKKAPLPSTFPTFFPILSLEPSR